MLFLLNKHKLLCRGAKKKLPCTTWSNVILSTTANITLFPYIDCNNVDIGKYKIFILTVLNKHIDSAEYNIALVHKLQQISFTNFFEHFCSTNIKCSSQKR